MSNLMFIFILVLYCGFTSDCISLCHPENEFSCKNGTCISVDWLCDNIYDCLEAEDEQECHYLHECAPNKFMCRSGQCLPKEVRCDGLFDCNDNSDEDSCIKPTILTSFSVTTPSSTIDAPVIQEKSYPLWVCLLYIILAFIATCSTCIGITYCLLIPKPRYYGEQNVKFIVMKEEENFTV